MLEISRLHYGVGKGVIRGFGEELAPHVEFDFKLNMMVYSGSIRE